MAQHIDHAALVLAEFIEDTEDDSATDNDMLSETTSITSSVMAFREENGFTYHIYKDGKYLLPNNQAENNRLDLQHNLVLLTLDGKLGLAPPCQRDTKVDQVLDVGCGTGLWCVDYADEHPEATIIGFDLSPSQQPFVPPNLKFEIADLDDEWGFSKPFDYIHSRMMNTCIPDWLEYFKKCYSNLAPGGWLEIQECDLWGKSNDETFQPGSPLWRATAYMEKACEIFGRPFAPIDSLRTLMVEAGFTDVVSEVFAWPINTWPRDRKLKELGAWSLENAVSNLSGIYMAPLTRAHGFTKKEVETFLVDVEKDLKDRNIHVYWPMHIIYGKRPGSKAV